MEAILERAVPYVRQRLHLVRKAASFAAIGVVNTLVDASVFFLVFGALNGSAAALWAFEAVSVRCGCGGAADLMLVAANVTGWMVGVTGSYVLNSTITFAAESGRKLRLRDYATFAASGVVGLLGNTATLVLVAQVMPVWFAKACAIGVSFVINFSMSHFVVFHPRRRRRAQ